MITYKRDDQLEYRQDLSKGLIAYNNAFAGDEPSESYNIYVFEGEELVGGCHSDLVWNWVYIGKIYYQNIDILITIMNELCNYFRGRVEGIYFESYIKEQIEDSKTAGFNVLGTLKDKPIGYESHILTNKEMKEISIGNTYRVEVKSEEYEAYSKIVDNKVNLYNKKMGIDDSKIEIEYNAFDQDKIVGGIYGYLMQDYLYLSTLWVDDAYRGKDIATKLMDLIEEEAKDKGYKYSYLGTCTFQARRLYEKRGYKVKMVITNCPKGYDDFMMVKDM